MTSNSDHFATPSAPVEWHRRFAPKAVLTLLAIVALCELSFYLLALRPAARDEQEREARYAALAAQVEQSRASVKAVQAQALRIAKADSDGNALVQEIALPRRGAFSALLTELGAASTGAGIEFRETSYAVDELEGSEEYGVLAVNASFRGRYENLLQFLYRLDRSDLFFIIGSLGATPREESNANELQINMRFDTLVRDR